MSITCVIVDDEPLAVKLLESYVSRTPFLTLQKSFTDSVEAIGYIHENPCDLVFLDIQMPDLNGMELAEMVPQQTRIIFTTAFKQYAFDSYGVNALDFLLKPIRYQKFLTAVEKAKQWFELKEKAEAPAQATAAESDKAPNPTSIFVKADRELQHVKLDDLLYVQGMKDYVVFVLKADIAKTSGKKDNTIITHMTMSTVEEMLPKDRFMRVNRSYIVSLDNIRAIDKNNCIYIGDEIIRVTDAYLDAFKSYLKNRLA